MRRRPVLEAPGELGEFGRRHPRVARRLESPAQPARQGP